jgi:hypothetical protein
LLDASRKDVPQKKESPGMYSVTGADVGNIASVGVMSEGLDSGLVDSWLPSGGEGLAAHVVCVKHDRPEGQSVGDPDGHGSSQLVDASSKVFPHMNESVSSHVV